MINFIRITIHKEAGSIGLPGNPGFGVGVCKDRSTLNRLELTPMVNCDDPLSINHGNYQYKDGSVFVYVPKFYYKIGDTSHPKYSIYKENTISIKGIETFKNENDANREGYILHRAFIDGGKEKDGFFRSKYSASLKSDNSGIEFVKNGNTVSLYNDNTYSTKKIPGCSGDAYDAIILAKMFNKNFHCESCFQVSALAMLSLAHAQSANDERFCGWYDINGKMNYPKGCNNYLKDIDDNTIKFEKSYGSNPLTGSGTPFNKTTHNGQNCGIADINGTIWRTTIGFVTINKKFCVLKESLSINDITKENVLNPELYDKYENSPNNAQRWGNAEQCVFYNASNGLERAINGIVPKVTSTNGTDLFGHDYSGLALGSCLIVGGHWSEGNLTGIFARNLHNNWGASSSGLGFAISAY